MKLTVGDQDNDSENTVFSSPAAIRNYFSAELNGTERNNPKRCGTFGTKLGYSMNACFLPLLQKREVFVETMHP